MPSDLDLIHLFFARDEAAIQATEEKYGSLCRSIAWQILGNAEDTEECLNDAWFGLWNAIPPERPTNFRAYLCRIVRNQALKRLEYQAAEKRASGSVVSLSELEEILPDPTADRFAAGELTAALNRFLAKEEAASRYVFLRKYWYFDNIGEICRKTGYSESKVKTILYRTRKKLKQYLKKEGLQE